MVVKKYKQVKLISVERTHGKSWLCKVDIDGNTRPVQVDYATDEHHAVYLANYYLHQDGYECPLPGETPKPEL